MRWRRTLGILLLLSGPATAQPSVPTAWQLLNDGDPDLALAPAAAYDTVRQRFVIVTTGGGDDDGPDHTWELVGEDWVRRFIPEPTPRSAGGACAAFDSVRGVTVMFGGVGSDKTWEYDGSAWTLRSPANRPPARHDCGMVYDESIQRMVMFGGYSAGFAGIADTWEYDGTDWVQVFPQNSPVPRGDVAMVYDPDNEITLLFGGRDGSLPYNDTWEYDGGLGRWTQQAPQDRPLHRGGAGMAYDPVRQKTVLFGGATPVSLYDDTWEWNGNNWSLIVTASFPQARWRVRMAYDPQRGTVVAHGGAEDNGAFNDTWSFDGTDWSRIAQSGLPINRADPSLVYDPRLAGLVLYGGRSSTKDIDLWDTWHYAAGQWTLENGSGTPSTSQFPLEYDPVNQRLVGFSGSPGQMQDVHEYRGQSVPWVSTPTCCPDLRNRHGWTYAPSSGGILMFGGRACCLLGSFYHADDTWLLDGMTWIQAAPEIQPEARISMGLTYDEANQRAILYGGTTNSGPSGRKADTWAFEGQEWQLLIENSGPGARSGIRLAYDSARDVIVLFGGGPALEGVTWEFDGAQWTARATLFQPDTDRCWAPMEYDPVNEVVMLFGGEKCGPSIYYNDTWAYGEDPDGDGIVGGLDNCRDSPNADQANGDGDPAGDLCDCASGDPGSFAPPSEVTGLAVDGDTITWDDQAPSVGSGVTYDLVSGGLQDLRANGNFSASQCLGPDLAVAGYTDNRVPLAGDGFYYVARAENACATSTYGPNRADLDAASPCP